MANKKYDSNKQKFADKLFAAYPELGVTADAVFIKIAALDPTADQKSDKNQYIYLEWLCSRILKEPPRAQDLYKIREDLENYSSLTRLDKVRASRAGTIFYRPFVNGEISQYSIATLAEGILPYTDLADRKKSASALEEERTKANSETVNLYNGPEGRIVVPLTMEASQFWGKGTRWCISATKSDNLFNQYYEDGKNPIIMFLPKGTREKFAFNDHDKSSARNMLDEGIVDPYQRLKESESPNVTILADFLISTLTSSEFKIDEVENNHHLTRAFQLFALWNPQVYSHILSKAGEENLPDILKLKNILPFCASYIKMAAPSEDEDNDDIDDKRGLVRSFISLDTVMTALTTEPAYQDIHKSIIEDIDPLDSADIIGRIADNILISPPTPFNNPDDYIADFREKYQKIQNVEEMGTDHFRDVVAEKTDESIMAYMATIPKAFWGDEDFSLAFISSANIFGSNFISVFPEAYNHTKVLHHLLSIMDIDLLAAATKEQNFKTAWAGKIDGVPLLEIAVDMTDSYQSPLVEDMMAALLLYEALGNTDGLDVSPIVRKVEGLYPDGFDDEDDVDYATTHMRGCDFTAILEKTIQRHPELFGDVAPEKQTMPMAIAAVKHDPGSLADMAAHLFKGDVRPPELTAAFNKLPPDSMERGAVADYFKAPEVS